MRNRIFITGVFFSLTIGQLLLTAESTAQQAQWVLASTSSPPSGRSESAMAYDWGRQRIVLFGGTARIAISNETWEWDGKSWTQIRPKTSPPPRGNHTLVYDFARKRVVLFGGMNNVTTIGDTWEWDGKDWKKLTPTPSPIRRMYHGMAYDIVRRRSVLYSGIMWNGNNDTWEWDGNSWARLKPTTDPGWRFNFSMAYDLARRQTVIFGGRSLPMMNIKNDTWTWDGKVWKQAVPATNSPSLRDRHAMAYDTLRQRTVLFGGHDPNSKDLNDTYEWDGRDWTQSSSKTSPSPRTSVAMAYDVARRQVVLFGGFGNGNRRFHNDTWLYSLKKTPGKYTSYGAGCGTPAVTLSAAPASTPTIGKSFLLDSRNLPQASTVAIMAFGASRTKFGPITLPLNLTAFGMPGCFLNQSMELLVPYLVKNGSGQFALPIPLNVQLIGATVFAQAMIVAPSANSAGLLSSNGGAVLIGN